MKVDNIFIKKRISDNLYYMETDIEPEDLLSILRYASHKGQSLGYLYDKNLIIYKNSESTTKNDFNFVLEKCGKDLSSWLDRFTREELVERVGSKIKIISSTTKTEIIHDIIRKKEILYQSFKKEFVEQHCSKWSEFRKSKIFLPAVSVKERTLVFALGSKESPLSGRHYRQFWRLGDRYNHIPLDENFTTEIVKDSLAINLRDADQVILKKMKNYLDPKSKKDELDVDDLKNEIKDNDLEVKDAAGFGYSSDIRALAEYFGRRRGSKFKTVCEGLRQRQDFEIVKDHLDKKFLIAAVNHSVYSGIVHEKEFFEKICLHLKIEYMKEKRMLCRMVEEETSETITALWEALGGLFGNQICLIEL